MAGVVLTNLTGYTFGVQIDETGINIQKVTVKTTSQKMEVKDKIGRVIGRADWDWKQQYSIEGYVAGTTGIAAATVGAILSLSNATNLGGITTGATILDDIEMDQSTGALNTLKITATRYNDIPTTAPQVTL